LELKLQAARRTACAGLKSIARRAGTQLEARRRGDRDAACLDSVDAKRAAPGGDLVATWTAQVDHQGWPLGGCKRRLGCQQPAAIAAHLAGSCRPATLRPGCERLVHQALDQGRRRCFAERDPQPPEQGLAPARDRECAPGGQIEAARVGDRGEVDRGNLVDHGGGVLDALRCIGQRALDIGEGVDERRPDAAAQAIAREAVVVVAVVVDPAQPVAPRISLDRLTRLPEPRTRPGDAVATNDLRHGRECGDAASAQRLEQESLGLVAPVVSQEDEIDAARKRHLAQGAIAGPPRPGLDALPCQRTLGETGGDQLDRRAAPRPPCAERPRMIEPGVGVRAEAMVNVKREHRHVQRRGLHERRVEQRGRIAPAAEGHGDDAPLPSFVSARSCR
jgi:hypothetical protein